MILFHLSMLLIFLINVFNRDFTRRSLVDFHTLCHCMIVSFLFLFISFTLLVALLGDVARAQLLEASLIYALIY